MGILDELMNQVTGAQTGAAAQPGASGLAGIVSTLASNPQVLGALASLLSPRDGAASGGGLAGLVGAFQQKGLGDMMASWISTGPNPPVTASQLSDVLGDRTIAKFASDAGVPPSEAGSLLAGLLPTVVDHLTPDGTLPDSGGIENALASLFSGSR